MLWSFITQWLSPFYQWRNLSEVDSYISRVISLVINEASTVILVLLKPKPVLLFIAKGNGFCPRSAFQIILGHTTTHSHCLPLSILPLTTLPLTQDAPHNCPSFCFSNTIELFLCFYCSFACTTPSPATSLLASCSKLTTSGRPALITGFNKCLPVPARLMFCYTPYFLHGTHCFFKLS